jgi:hypothetical protein
MERVEERYSGSESMYDWGVGWNKPPLLGSMAVDVVVTAVFVGRS